MNWMKRGVDVPTVVVCTLHDSMSCELSQSRLNSKVNDLFVSFSRVQCGLFVQHLSQGG